jgi:hypothetical protein
LFVVSGTLRRSGAGKPRAAAGAGPAGQVSGAPPGKALKPAKSKAPAADDDLGDVADILRKHGIR